MTNIYDINEVVLEMGSCLVSLFNDEDVEEIYVDSYNNVTFSKSGKLYNHDECFDSPEHFAHFCQIAINEHGDFKGVNYVSFTGFSNHRISIYVPSYNLDHDKYFMIIRLFRKLKITSEDLISFNMLSHEQYLLILSFLEKGKNIIFSGAPKSGKTTLMRCVLNDFLRNKNIRVGVLEDPKELFLDYKHGFEIDVNKDKSDPCDALSFCFRSSPAFLAVGELLSPKMVYTFVKSLEGGFSGTISTIHAHSANLTISRMATLMVDENKKLAKEDLITTLRECIDLVVHIDMDFKTGVRCVDEILEIN